MFSDSSLRSTYPFLPVSMVVPQTSTDGGARFGSAESRIMLLPPELASLYSSHLMYTTPPQAAAQQPSPAVLSHPTGMVRPQPPVAPPFTVAPNELPRVSNESYVLL